ncbi:MULTISPECIES: carbon-phosphorus lyase complex subunit PhnI [Bosea]|uniref:carbon-phosphorus lyase complex subunit PhnI n=1 Tax=Bosea TaxID=85413 RepID=UPI0021502A17|nr:MULTISPECIES: carbon-phosphorus lyase complex subunit PhnI [Bosea]MCR4522909.1 carbon-phosphorus lyase complex subunit PhnI [Bosea sp. 47.2.35]MDR6828172.1 alpha-D-ribose 1-methylphosphonate 5-triphosphate synthase subunit PhnI [Bosea robiniae]MDR6894678.1 alpha-D-ribose 1-methylphosphonate 5-triphosphate synthase subunit PhnI [Bosea sp. BE109]MDR7138278.1 alpha-D-ribose 1-methylphosphonate 5-triphosphate synthase subunit PhnI [Bosea sp. BE168]MDR7174977.1 alpha-D-ribose 1-methylphosphonate
MYVAVKGGEAAILATHDLVAEARRGDPAVPEISVAQIREQQALACARVMNEGSLYDQDLAALALKQSQGDVIEAAFLMRAYRTTLPRFGSSEPLDTAAMAIRRRVSATYKDLPGGQVLGPTYDYTHRLFDFALMDEGGEAAPRSAPTPLDATMPRVPDILGAEGLMEAEEPPEGDPRPFDLTRDPVSFPADRDVRLQSMARGDEGFLLGLGYSVQRGFGGTHPFVGEVRVGEVAVEFVPEELGFAVDLGDVTLTECQMVNQFQGSKEVPPQFTRGYGLVFGHSERKAMSMSLVDRALKARDFGEATNYPAQQDEFVLYHADNVEAAGFVEHLKLPHYVDFQGELELIRRIRREREERLAREQGAKEPDTMPEAAE